MLDMTTTVPLVRIENLRIALPDGADRPYAVDAVSFDLYPGKILCVVGESGSGKSMSANALMGLLPEGVRVNGGAIRLGGEDLLALDEAGMRALRGRRVAMIFQEPMSALNPLMRIEDQIAEVFEAHGLLRPAERMARALALLEEVGLPDPKRAARSYPHQLSGGQRQRVVIAMALALEPEVLVADEPTTALDVTTQAQILELIRKLQISHKMAVMFITHDFGVVAEIADHVAVMQLGRVVEEGPAAQVLRAPRHPYTIGLIKAIPKLRGGRAPAATPAASAAPDMAQGTTSNAAADTTPDTAPGRAPLMQIEGACKTYRMGLGLFRPPRLIEAVKDVSVTIGRGETLGIVGESGSGKSSFGRCLVRLQDLDQGRILLDGQDVTHTTGTGLREMRRRVQMIFQDPFASLNPRIRVGRAIADGPIAYGTPVAQAMAEAEALLARVGLPGTARRFPHEFSGGQRQRIGIARALALRPELIVADEAVSALDVSIQAQVLDLLDDLKRELGLSLVFITHDLRVAAQICDRVMVMQKGVCVETGPGSQIFDAPQHPYTRSLIAAIPGKEWDQQAG